jgi:transcriptional regulator with XRE-family HTH domain/predicted negative regulator of RcsB-dependent stress response
VFAEHAENSDAAEVGARLRERRLARGLLQQDLATAEISSSYVSLIEAGKRRPSPTVLATLAERVGSSVEYLLTGRDETELSNLRLELGFAEMALRNGAHGEALQSFNQTLAKAAALDPAMRLRARIGQAGALENLGRREAAIEILHELSEDPVLVAGSTEWADVMVALCRCYRVVGDVNMSVEIGERAMRRLDSLGLDVTDDHIKLGVDLVGSYFQRSDFTRAHLLSVRLLAQAEKTGSRNARGMVYWNAGLVAESRGQRDEAIALVERALGFMAEGDNPRHLAMLKVLRGWLLLRSTAEDATQAKELLEQAKVTLLEAGTVHELGDCEVGLSMANLRLGHFQLAQEHASRALGILGSETSDLTAEAQVALGEAQILRGDLVEGEASLRAALRQLDHLPHGWKTATVYRYLGDVWNRHGRTEEAMQAYQCGLTAGGADAMLPPPVPSTSRARSSEASTR